MREKWQVFTPEGYVNVLLDSIEYNDDIIEKKILENSCGDGNILAGIVSRYICECKKRGYSKESIENGLENDIYGIEIEEKFYRNCISKLNDITDEAGLRKIKWNIYLGDYLKLDLNMKFDYVVSNPPYIAHVDLPEEKRDFLRRNYETCSHGKFDYCYAFIEKGFNSLSPKGKMAYLIPSSIFKNVFGDNLRELIKSYVDKVIDYTTVKVFDRVLVSSAIVTVDMAKRLRFIQYKDVAADMQMMIDKESLIGKWNFGLINNGTRRFGDFFNVSYPVATLLNDVYVIKNWEKSEDEHFIITKESLIEKDITLRAVSPRNLKSNKYELIIFPYNLENGHVKKFEEKDFMEKFPKAYKFLNENRERLDKRKKDKNGKWYEYGRSQALGMVNCRKLITSTVVTEKVRIYYSSEGEIPYAGMCIKTINEDISLEDAKLLLESPLFYEYVKRVGVYVNGTSIRITAKDVEAFCF